MILVQIVASGLAGWRLASLLVVERGPWSIFKRIRTRAGAEDFEIDGFFAELLSCIWCTSVWTVAAMWVTWYIYPPVVGIVAAMGAAMIVERQAR